MLLTNREQYNEWARITHLHCVEKHTDISRYFFTDDSSVDDDIINKRRAEARGISDICNQAKEEAPRLDNDADEEQLKNFILRSKVLKLKQEGREKQRICFESCVAFIKTRISEDMAKLIEASGEVIKAEKDYNIYEWWVGIRNVFIPTGTSKAILAIKAGKELATMVQGANEDIKQYVVRYTRCRDELQQYGYQMFNKSDLDGVMFIHSLNDRYIELKNSVINGITRVETFIEARETSLKWAIKQAESSDATEVAMAATSKKTIKRNSNKKPRRCYICKGEHMMAECPVLSKLKGAQSITMGEESN